MKKVKCSKTLLLLFIETDMPRGDCSLKFCWIVFFFFRENKLEPGNDQTVAH